MSAIPFDTLKLARALRDEAKMDADQAEGVAKALAEAFRDEVATKADLKELAGELKLWTAGLAGVVIAALSAIKFFGH